MVYNDGDSYLCVVNASNKDKALTWLKSNQKPGVDIIDESDATGLLPLQGPSSVDLLRDIIGANIDHLEYMHFGYFNIDGVRCLISRSGYTGEDGFEIYMPSDRAGKIWQIIVEKGGRHGLALTGLGARDILRIEAGYPLYGHEIDDNTDPYSASLGWAVKLNKDFIAKEKLLKIKQAPLKSKRVGFVMEDRSMPRQGYAIVYASKNAGKVTSGAFSPNANGFVGMASVDSAITLDSEVQIDIRGNAYKARIKKFPFVEIRTKREAQHGRA